MSHPKNGCSESNGCFNSSMHLWGARTSRLSPATTSSASGAPVAGSASSRCRGRMRASDFLGRSRIGIRGSERPGLKILKVIYLVFFFSIEIPNWCFLKWGDPENHRVSILNWFNFGFLILGSPKIIQISNGKNPPWLGNLREKKLCFLIFLGGLEANPKAMEKIHQRETKELEWRSHCGPPCSKRDETRKGERNRNPTARDGWTLMKLDEHGSSTEVQYGAKKSQRFQRRHRGFDWTINRWDSSDQEKTNARWVLHRVRSRLFFSTLNQL